MGHILHISFNAYGKSNELDDDCELADADDPLKPAWNGPNPAFTEKELAWAVELDCELLPW